MTLITPELESAIQAAANAAVKNLLADPPPTLLVRSRLLRPKEAGRYLACSRATLYRLEAAGTLRPKRLGRMVAYDLADLDAFVRNQSSRR